MKTPTKTETAAKIASLVASGWGAAIVVPEGTYAGTTSPDYVGVGVRGAWTIEIREATDDEPLRMRARVGVAR